MADCKIPWSGKSIASFHEKLNNFGVPIRRNDYTKELSNNENAKCLSIRMNVVDSQNCVGPFVNTTIPFVRNFSENVIASDFFGVPH